MESVYRILTAADWELCMTLGRIAPGPLDELDGYIHLSARQAVLESANRYFDPHEEIVVVELAVDRLGPDLRWEWVADRGASFPHLYADGVPVSAVSATHSLRHDDDRGFSWGERAPL